jgi:hypothetical protein
MAYTNITNITYILDKFLTDLKSEANDVLHPVFDPSLTYEESIRGIRALRSSFQVQENTVYPLLAFNRRPLVKSDIIPRLFNAKGETDSNSEVDKYKFFWGEFEFLFKYIVKNPTDIEEFEILYGMEEHIGNIKVIPAVFPIVGEVEFYVSWNKLEELEFNKENSIYVAAGSSAKVSGRFILIEDTPEKIIEEINLYVKDFETRYTISQTVIT